MKISNKGSKNSYIVLEYFTYKERHMSSRIFRRYKCLNSTSLKEVQLYNINNGERYWSSVTIYEDDLSAVKRNPGSYEFLEHVILNEESIILI